MKLNHNTRAFSTVITCFLFVCFFVENSQADMLHVFQMQNKVTFLYPTTNILSKSVIFIPTKEREKERTVGIFKVSFFAI